MIEIRRAKEQDMDGINNLLMQVCLVHHKGRPDLFKYGAKKYTDDQLRAIIHDIQRPIFTAVDENETVLGYAFCIFQQHIDDNILTDIKTLYIDDLCVDENLRGQHIGRRPYGTPPETHNPEPCSELLPSRNRSGKEPPCHWQSCKA